MAYADIADVEVDYGPIGDADTARVESLIERAEAQVTLRVPDLPARLDSGRTTMPLVKQVIGEMVANVLRNPRGAVTFTESKTNGPFSATQSGTLAAGSAAGTLVLTRRHLTLLGGHRGAQTVPYADPALRRLFRRPCFCRRYEHRHEYGDGCDSFPGEGEDRYGFVWPTDQVPTT